MASTGSLTARIQELELRLREANEALNTIRHGQVDICTLQGADHPYRLLVEDLREGALTLSPEGTILYANRRFAEMVGAPLEQVIGSPLREYVAPDERERVEALLRDGEAGASRGEAGLSAVGGAAIPVFLSINSLEIGGVRIQCLLVTDVTEQKRTEQILAAEALSRAILEQAAEAIVVTDAQGKIVRASRAASALFGGDVLERRFEDAFPLVFEAAADGTASGARSLVKAACVGQPVRGVEAVLPRLPAPPAHVLVSAGPLTGNQTTGCVITLTDITAHRKAQEDLRASQERARLAVEAASIGVWSYEIATGEMVWSEREYALFGLPPGEPLTLERWLSLVHPEDRERVRATLEKAIATRSGQAVEFRVVWPDGSVHWVSGSGSVQCDASGRATRVQGTNLDMDERRRMEDELRQAGETVRAIIDGAPVAIWVLDATGRVALWNPAAEALFGYTAKEALPAPGLFPVTSPAGADLEERAAARESVSNLEAVCQTKDGQRIDVILSVSALWRGDGGLRGYVAVAADLRERKRLEGQVRQAQKLESIGLLAGGVAHDFNNLLTGIVGNASLIVTAPLPADTRERVEAIIRVAERAADLTRQLLAYAGKGQFIAEPVDLSNVVRMLLPLLRTSLPKKAEVQLSLQEDILPIEADPSQIQQVVMNLTINAGEALGDAVGRVAIRTGMEEVSAARAADLGLTPGTYATLEVTDTGCGMDEATRARVFDPFFSTKFTGRGLGLAAVDGIVRSCRGAIEVRTRLGAGATFTVRLPAVHRKAVETPPPRRVRRFQASGLVLVVDDEEIIRSTAGAALRHFGYGVVTAGDGREAVQIFTEKGEDIDLVLLDVKMPALDGWEALAEMQKIRPGVPVLISSGHNETEAVRAFHGRGAAGFVQKPYRAGELAAAVRAAIKGARANAV